MIYELLDWEMVEADQGYVGQPNKIHVKYEPGKTSSKLRQGQGQEGRQSKEGSRIFAYLSIDIKSQCTAMCFMLLLF